MSAPDPHRERVAALAEVPRFRLLGGVRASRVVATALDAVLRTVLPPVCAGCGVSGYWICPICDQLVRRIDLSDVCARCGSPARAGTACSRCAGWTTALGACRSAYVFDGAIRQTIHQLKYRGEYARAEWCGIELARLAIELDWQPDLLVPVPLHRTRLRSRGYNQSAKIAAVTSTALATPWGNVLTRTRATMSQVGLDAMRRRENVNGAFACRHDLGDLEILLVDDVVTTGATIEACAEACWRAGARDVRALTLATGS